MEEDIISYCQKNKINYDDVYTRCQFHSVLSERVDVSIIIPVMDREDFHNPLVTHLKQAIKYHPQKTYAITFVEHSETPKHKNLAAAHDVNHIWIPKQPNVPFNKCLAMNIGARFSNDCEYYMFHDIDCLMIKDFFTHLFQNLDRVGVTPLQTFASKRVFPMSAAQTAAVCNGSQSLETITPDYNGIKSGAAGGSILIHKERFQGVGGYDPEFFSGYSVEDGFFYRKLLSKYGCFHGSNNPVIHSYHMYHEPMWRYRPRAEKERCSKIYQAFMNATHEQQLEFLKFKAEDFTKI